MSDTDGRRVAPVGADEEAAWQAGYDGDEVCPWCGARRVVGAENVKVCDNCWTVQVVTARYVPRPGGEHG